MPFLAICICFTAFTNLNTEHEHVLDNAIETRNKNKNLERLLLLLVTNETIFQVLWCISVLVHSKAQSKRMSGEAVVRWHDFYVAMASVNLANL